MPNAPQNDAGGTIETEEGTLPEATRAPEPAHGLILAEVIHEPALSEEELQARQAAIGVRRKPDGPPREDAPLDDADTQPSDVPETGVTSPDGGTQ